MEEWKYGLGMVLSFSRFPIPISSILPIFQTSISQKSYNGISAEEQKIALDLFLKRSSSQQ